MGVRGLTSYIARHAELYLMPYELHDCNLIIDGDSLACNIYKDATGTCSAFGGDYDDFYNAVLNFFQVLAECNIEAYVLMDGGYEKKKLRTVGKRLRGKIAVIKRINPCGSTPVFPQMMKEVFIDAVRQSNVPVMRCVFEADDEMATLSRKLGCPVLTYDSDFYIHNVLYIPLVTLTVKAHIQVLKDNVDNAEQPNALRILRKNEVKHIEKLTKSEHILGEIQVDNLEKRTHKKGKKYKYLDCCIYRIEHLIKNRSLSKEKLPLFAAMVGNDYIAKSSFGKFFRTGMGKVGRSRKLTLQQRRINSIMEWLKKQSLESALEMILSRLRLSERESLMAQVNAAISGYSNEICHSYEYFVENYESAFETFPPRKFDEINGFDEDEEYTDDDDTELSCEEELENAEEIEANESLDDRGEAAGNNSVEEDVTPEDVNEVSDDKVGANSDSEGEKDLCDKTKMFPQWFLRKLYPAYLPRFFVDLMHLQKYINNPQIEHFPYNDCSEVALPILIYIFTLLNSVDLDEKEDQQTMQFTYLTRATKVTNIQYIHFDMETEAKYNFNPNEPNPLLMRQPFEKKMHNLDVDMLFTKVKLLPKDLQLYFLSIVYWLQKSQHYDIVHLHALLICLVVIRTVDSKIPPVRDVKAFYKRFGKIVKHERVVRDKEAQVGTIRSIREELRALPITERVNFTTKSDCFLVQDNLLKHFHMQEIFKKKYDNFSTTVLHAFAEFQSIVFQMNALNALLDRPFTPPKMGSLYSGIFLYNLYDLFKNRTDIVYYVQNFLLHDSQMMFEFYTYLLYWCELFVPTWKKQNLTQAACIKSKKLLKKKRQAKRKLEQNLKEVDPNAEMVDRSETNDEDEFFDLNNKFCNFLKIK